jgi:hypothetical protein
VVILTLIAKVVYVSDVAEKQNDLQTLKVIVASDVQVLLLSDFGTGFLMLIALQSPFWGVILNENGF